jgi:hypothetical protein
MQFLFILLKPSANVIKALLSVPSLLPPSLPARRKDRVENIVGAVRFHARTISNNCSKWNAVPEAWDAEWPYDIVALNKDQWVIVESVSAALCDTILRSNIQSSLVPDCIVSIDPKDPQNGETSIEDATRIIKGVKLKMVMAVPLDSPDRALLGNKQDRRVGEEEEKGFDKEGGIRTQDKFKSGEVLYEVRREMETVLEGREPEIELGAEPGERGVQRWELRGDGRQEVRTLTAPRSKMP